MEERSVDLPDCDPGNKERDELVDILEGIGIEVYDHETDDELRAAIRANIEDETLDGLDEYREAAQNACNDNLDDFMPQMNFAYPVKLRGMSEGEAQTKVMDTSLVVVTIDDEPYLALHGGGMDMSWHICRAYIALGLYPPAHFCELPMSKGDGDAEVVTRCIESVETAKGWLKSTEARLNTIANMIADGEL